MGPRQLVPAVLLTLATAGTLAACAIPGTALPVQNVPAATIAPSTRTVYATPPPTHTVYVQPPGSTDLPASSQWYAQPSWIDTQPYITITPSAGQTDCQWLYAHGYSYAQAFAAWAQNDYPANWSATSDGYPCQRTYGMQH